MRWLERKGRGAAREQPVFRRVGRIDEIPPGSGKVVVVMGREIGVFNVGGELKAVENVCPHNNRPIGTIEFDDRHVTCIWHGLRFRFADGVCPEAEHYRLRTYAVRIEDGHILLGPADGLSGSPEPGPED